MSELDQVNETKIVEGSPLLAGAGLISIQAFCETFEIAAEVVLQEILNNNIRVACRLSVQTIYWVDDYTKVDREIDTGGFVLNSAFEEGIQRAFTGYLKPFHRAPMITNLIECGYSEETAFRFKENTLAAAFCDLPGVRITISSVFITKIQAERIRAPWVTALSASKAPLNYLSTFAVTQHLNPSLETSLAISKLPELEARFCNPKFSRMLSSTLLAKFFDHKTSGWKPGQHERVATICGAFINLMGDPMLGAIDRDLVRKYEAKLRIMPSNRYQAAQRHGTNDADELIRLADQHCEKRMSSQSVESYIDRLSELFNWARTEDYLSKNPAEKIIRKVQGLQTRAQDARDKFDQNDLDTIFSAEWFQLGGAKRNKAGRLSEFRPHYYWLPLLGLYTGARLNEICQLYLEEIVEYEPGKLYIFINQEEPGTEGSKPPTKCFDKSIKNTTSKRCVPIHSELITLGLIEYIHALKVNGYNKLFPELRFDRVKGYSRAASSWFNEHFLGKKLKFERNGMKTFHSFRHSCITSLIDKAIPENIISEIAGHERGETTSLNRYGKDAAARLHPHLEKLDFKLPTIQPFKTADGLVAIKHALRRRKPSL
jgi:integrase